jgi:hypothetical protein
MSTLFWKSSEQSRDTVNRYAQLGFERNPFPVDPCVKPDSENDLENGKIYLSDIRQEEQKTFDNLIIHKKGGSEAKRITLLMDYAAFRGRGIGKTAFLNHQLKRINGDFGWTISEENETICAVYVKPGGDKNERKFWQLSKLITESISDQKLLHVALSRIRAFSGLIPPEILEMVTTENIEETILNSEWLSENNIDELRLRTFCRSELSKAGIDKELSDKIYMLGQGKGMFFDYFLAAKSESFWRSNENGILYNDLVRLFKLAGFSSCVILFDESEKVITVQNLQERRAFCDNLRYFFIDGASENVKSHFFRLLLTVHPYSQELLNPHWSASGLNRFVELGGDSAKHYTIFFQPLDKESAIPLAQLYLSNSKINKYNEGQVVDISPFTEAALQKILLSAEGIPGRFLQFLHLAIESAVNDDWKIIDTDEIERVIKTDITLLRIENENRQVTFSRTETNLNT